MPDLDPTPRPEPAQEPYDRHEGPLDDPSDARYLRPEDPRRREVERRGHDRQHLFRRDEDE